MSTPNKKIPASFIEGLDNTSFIEVTKTELDTHILNSTLKPGSLYKITGVQPFLYGGTDIYLRAISTNALEEKGMGKFYVPKYDKNVDRYGIFNGYVNVTVTDSSYPAGTINYEDSVTTNNGATGKFRSINLIEYVSGDWGTVTKMYVNGITFNVTSATTSTYNINDKVIFGGKVWRNITGNHGNIVDIFTLSNDWEVIPYNETDYNIEFDEIGYDIENDCLNYRRDKSNNIVEFSYNWWFYFENDWRNGDMENSFSNPIKSFQWGNHFDYDFYKGNMVNSIHNSLFECINSTLVSINSNILENNGYIYSNTLNIGSIRIGFSNPINNKQIKNLIINSGDIGGDDGINLSTATLVYADYERIVFKNSAGETKIRYIDGSGNTVIANLTD